MIYPKCNEIVSSFTPKCLRLCNFNATSEQGWEFVLLLIPSSLFHPKSLILKSDHEQIALVALNKRATMSESLSLLFKEEQHSWFARDLSKSLLKDEWLAWKNSNFKYVFDSF